MTDYRPEADRDAMYRFITPLLREHRIRKGLISPVTEEDRRWAAEGERRFVDCENFVGEQP
jgi:hypothetical protein